MANATIVLPPTEAVIDEVLASGVRHLLAGKYFQLAAFVMLIYDHMITLDAEVDRIWNRKFSFVNALFFLNRYITPLQFIIILDAFHDPRWTQKACDNFVLFEGTSTVAMIAICELQMIIRVYGMCSRSRPVLFFLLSLWIAQIVVSFVGLRTGFAVPLPPFLVGCILTGSDPLFPSLWVAPLITGSCIFALTLWSIKRLPNKTYSRIVRILFRDGILYFLLIFVVNLMNTLLFFLAPADLKAIGASFSQLITAVMVSRLVLNLRNPEDQNSECGSSSIQSRTKLAAKARRLSGAVCAPVHRPIQDIAMMTFPRHMSGLGNNMVMIETETGQHVL